MNIIHVTPHYPPSLGGMERVAQALAQRQAAAGHTVEVLTSSLGSVPGVTRPTKNLTIRRYRFLEFMHTPIIPGIAARLLRAPKDAVVHVHVGMALVPEMTALAARLRGLPYVIHFHLDIGPFRRFQKILPVYKRHVFGRVLRNANAVVCLAHSHTLYLQREYGVPKEKMVVIPNGVGDEFFKPTSFVRKNKQPTIFSICRLSPQKNLPLAIRSVAAMKKQCQYRIVGEGEERPVLEQAVRRAKTDRVTLVGAKDGRDKLDEYWSADIFLMTSLREGMPLTILEAMAAGLAIVSVDIDGVREVVADVGVLVPTATPKAIAHELDALVNNPKRLATLKRQSVRAARRYRWEPVAKEFMTVYRTVLHDN